MTITSQHDNENILYNGQGVIHSSSSQQMLITEEKPANLPNQNDKGHQMGVFAMKQTQIEGDGIKSLTYQKHTSQNQSISQLQTQDLQKDKRIQNQYRTQIEDDREGNLPIEFSPDIRFLPNNKKILPQHIRQGSIGLVGNPEISTRVEPNQSSMRTQKQIRAANKPNVNQQLNMQGQHSRYKKNIYQSQQKFVSNQFKSSAQKHLGQKRLESQEDQLIEKVEGLQRKLTVSNKINLNLNNLSIHNQNQKSQGTKVNSEYYDINLKATASNQLSHRATQQSDVMSKSLKTTDHHTNQQKFAGRRQVGSSFSSLKILPSLPGNKQSSEMMSVGTGFSRKESREVDQNQINNLQEILLQSSRLSAQKLKLDPQTSTSPEKIDSSNFKYSQKFIQNKQGFKKRGFGSIYDTSNPNVIVNGNQNLSPPPPQQSMGFSIRNTQGTNSQLESVNRGNQGQQNYFLCNNSYQIRGSRNVNTVVQTEEETKSKGAIAMKNCGSFSVMPEITISNQKSQSKNYKILENSKRELIKQTSNISNFKSQNSQFQREEKSEYDTYIRIAKEGQLNNLHSQKNIGKFQTEMNGLTQKFDVMIQQDRIQRIKQKMIKKQSKEWSDLNSGFGHNHSMLSVQERKGNSQNFQNDKFQSEGRFKNSSNNINSQYKFKKNLQNIRNESKSDPDDNSSQRITEEPEISAGPRSEENDGMVLTEGRNYINEQLQSQMSNQDSAQNQNIQPLESLRLSCQSHINVMQSNVLQSLQSNTSKARGPRVVVKKKMFNKDEHENDQKMSPMNEQRIQLQLHQSQNVIPSTKRSRLTNRSNQKRKHSDNGKQKLNNNSQNSSPDQENKYQNNFQRQNDSGDFKTIPQNESQSTSFLGMKKKDMNSKSGYAKLKGGQGQGLSTSASFTTQQRNENDTKYKGLSKIQNNQLTMSMPDIQQHFRGGKPVIVQRHKQSQISIGANQQHTRKKSVSSNPPMKSSKYLSRKISNKISDDENQIGDYNFQNHQSLTQKRNQNINNPLIILSLNDEKRHSLKNNPFQVKSVSHKSDAKVIDLSYQNKQSKPNKSNVQEYEDRIQQNDKRNNDIPSTEDEDEELSKNGQIRIKINKNKQILNHLAKFTRDISSALGKNEGMTLLFYDFNGSKSNLSIQSPTQNQFTNQQNLEVSAYKSLEGSVEKDQRQKYTNRGNNHTEKPPDTADSTKKLLALSKANPNLPAQTISIMDKPKSPCFGAFSPMTNNQTNAIDSNQSTNQLNPVTLQSIPTVAHNPNYDSPLTSKQDIQNLPQFGLISQDSLVQQQRYHQLDQGNVFNQSSIEKSDKKINFKNDDELRMVRQSNDNSSQQQQQIDEQKRKNQQKIEFENFQASFQSPLLFNQDNIQQQNQIFNSKETNQDTFNQINQEFTCESGQGSFRAKNQKVENKSIQDQCQNSQISVRNNKINNSQVMLGGKREGMQYFEINVLSGCQVLLNTVNNGEGSHNEINIGESNQRQAIDQLSFQIKENSEQTFHKNDHIHLSFNQNQLKHCESSKRAPFENYPIANSSTHRKGFNNSNQSNSSFFNTQVQQPGILDGIKVVQDPRNSQTIKREDSAKQYFNSIQYVRENQSIWQ